MKERLKFSLYFLAVLILSITSFLIHNSRLPVEALAKWGPMIHFLSSATAQTSGPTIGNIVVVTTGNIEKYAKFEISFPVTTVATNPYFPYASTAPPGVNAGIGISVDMTLTKPSGGSKTIPCFYYQPTQRMGSGTDVALVPTGFAQWRCRFATDIAGTWQYKVQATDAGGTSAFSPTGQFNVVNPSANSPTRHGFIQTRTSNPSLSGYDQRFFMFSDGTPFTTPLINIEQNAFTSLYGIENQIRDFGNNGIRFVRWFPNSETGKLVLYGGWLKDNWGYSSSSRVDYPDTASGKKFSFRPDAYETSQTMPAVHGATYSVSYRAFIMGSKTLSATIAFSDGNSRSWSNTANGVWSSYGNNHFYSLTNSGNADYVSVTFHDVGGSGDIRMSDMVFQRNETENNAWGPNLLSRSDADTYAYVDQISAARFDVLLNLSEQYGVYHKLPLFWKEDYTLSRFQYDGSVSDNYSFIYFYGSDSSNWYERAYERYFAARWSYSPAIHSIEQANENDPGSIDDGIRSANNVKALTPRFLITSNSYWHWLPIDPLAWTDPSMDYADRHWYATGTGDGTPGGGYSNSTVDAVQYTRDCNTFFKSYNKDHNVNKPFVQGESGTAPNKQAVMDDPTGTWYHKQLWTNLGILGYSCGGEWYPNYDTMYPSYKAYDTFISGEALNNGSHVEIGTDLIGDNQITNTNSNLRAFGSKDSVSARVLVWVDNSNNTWANNPGGASSENGTFSVSGMPNGSYTREAWDTRLGTYVSTSNAINVTNQILTFTTTTGKDIAYKFYLPGVIPPTSTPGPTIPTPTQSQLTNTPPPSPTPACPLAKSGDINCSGKVNALDLSILLGKFGTSDPASDLNSSGKVNALDMSILLSNFGRTNSIATPTPSTNKAYVQSQMSIGYNTSTSLSTTFPQTVTTGNLVVVAVSDYAEGNARITGVSDNRGNTYQKAVGNPAITGDSEVSIWYKEGVVGGSPFTVTASSQTSSYITIAVHEYSGFASSSSLDKTQNNNSSGTTATSGLTSTTSSPNELIFGAFLHDSASLINPTAGANFTLRQSQPEGAALEPLVTEDRIVSVTGTYEASLTWSDFTLYRGTVATFR